MRLLAVFGVLTCTNAELAADIGQLVMASLSEENSSQALHPVAAPDFWPKSDFPETKKENKGCLGNVISGNFCGKKAPSKDFSGGIN